MAFHLHHNDQYEAIPNAEVFWVHHRQRRPSDLCFIAAFRNFVIIPIAILLLILTVHFVLTTPSSLPKLSIDSFSVAKFNATSARDVTVEFDAIVRSEQPFWSFSVRCFDHGSVSVSYSGVTVADGVTPEFCQWPGRVTAFRTMLKGSNIVLSDAESDGLAGKRKREKTALEVDIKLPSRYADVMARCRVIRACSQAQLKALPCAVKEETSFQQKAQREVLSCFLIIALWVMIISVSVINPLVFVVY